MNVVGLWKKRESGNVTAGQGYDTSTIHQKWLQQAYDVSDTIGPSGQSIPVTCTEEREGGGHDGEERFRHHAVLRALPHRVAVPSEERERAG